MSTHVIASSPEPEPAAYLIDTHVGASSQLVACTACTVRGEWNKGLPEDCQPLSAADLDAIADADETPAEEPTICELCGKAITIRPPFDFQVWQRDRDAAVAVETATVAAALQAGKVYRETLHAGHVIRWAWRPHTPGQTGNLGRVYTQHPQTERTRYAGSPTYYTGGWQAAHARGVYVTPHSAAEHLTCRKYGFGFSLEQE